MATFETTPRPGDPTQALESRSSIGRIKRNILGDRPLPAVAVREQALLVVIELLGCLGCELEVRSQDDGVNRTGLLAEAAVNAFHHVDVEASGPPRAVAAPVPRGPRALGLEVRQVQADLALRGRQTDLALLGRPSRLLGLEVLEAPADRDGLAFS